MKATVKIRYENRTFGPSIVIDVPDDPRGQDGACRVWADTQPGGKDRWMVMVEIGDEKFGIEIKHPTSLPTYVRDDRPEPANPFPGLVGFED